MILLDTNVVSETTRAVPDKTVIAWLDNQIAESLYLSTISLAELHLGIALMPDGRRKDALHRAVTTIIGDLFGARILAFDGKAALVFSELMSVSRADGFQIGRADGQIAAIARANEMIVATSDTGPFEAAGLSVVNPWI